MRSASTLGTDIIKRSNSVGVAFSRRRYTQSDNIVLYISAHQPGAVTPAAKRNTYSVAIMVVLAPRVAVFVRNTGLGNRNTYSVAVACGKLCLSSPVSMWYGRVDYGPLVQLLPLGEGWDGASAGTPSPWKAGMGLLVYYVFSISPWEYRYSQQDIYLY